MGRIVYLVPMSESGRERLKIVQNQLDRTSTKWEELSSDDIKFNLKDGNKNIFVCDPMQGDAYEKLIAADCTVLGCGAVISSLALKVSLPRRKKFNAVGGLFSMALHGCEICVTNVPKENRETMMRKLIRMGGKVSPNMSTNVTHLIVGEVNSKKYIVATENNIMTLTPKWVEELWEKSVKQLEPMTCQSENFADICKSYLCPIFHGCAFSVSNLSTEMRTDVANLIVTNGGLYMGQMDKNKCTHLVIGTPGGKKHQYAKKWGITVVPLRWIRDSIKREYALSTDLPEYQIEDFDASTMSDMSTASRIVVEETVANHSVANPSESADLELFLQKQIDPDEELFQSMRFRISGFSERHTSMIQRRIRDCGGYVFDSLSPSVTRMICSTVDPERNPEMVSRNMMNGAKPLCVNVYWLMKCISEGDLVDEKAFLLYDDQSASFLEFDRSNTAAVGPRQEDLQDQTVQKGTTSHTFGTLEISAAGDTTVVDNESESETLHENNVSGVGGSGPTFRIMNGLDHNVTYSADDERDLVDDLKSEIANAQGRLLAEADGPKADFAISFGSVRSDFHHWRERANHFMHYDWMIAAKPDFALGSYWRHRVFFCHSRKLFEGVAISVTGFTSEENETLRDIIQSGGGKFLAEIQKSTTHLVTLKGGGKKLEFAKKCQIQIATPDWLLKCCEVALDDPSTTWRQVTTAEFVPTESVTVESPFRQNAKLPLPKTISERSMNANHRSMAPCSTKSSARKSRKSSKGGFDIEGMMEEIETPEARRKSDIPKTSEINRILSKAAQQSNEENCRINEKGIYSKSAVKQKEERSKYPKTPKLQGDNIPKKLFCARESLARPPKYLGDAVQSQPGLFHGVCVFVHETISDRIAVGEMINEMGGTMRMEADDVTHYLVPPFVGQVELARLRKQCEERDQILCSITWLQKSSAANKMLDAAKFAPVEEQREKTADEELSEFQARLRERRSDVNAAYARTAAFDDTFEERSAHAADEGKSASSTPRSTANRSRSRSPISSDETRSFSDSFDSEVSFG